MAICKKHGDIEDRTMVIEMKIQPVIVNTNPEIELPIETRQDIFCMECLTEFLTKKIGTCKE